MLMHKWFLFIGIVLLGGLVVVGCQKKVQVSEDKSKLQVGLVFNVGGRGDKSFNDSAYAGLELVARKYQLVMGKDIEYIEPSESMDRESALRQLAQKGKKVIIGTGFLISDDINRVAKDYPQIKFACVDYVPPQSGEIPANVVGLQFKEEQGSFLVGALAGMMTKTNKVAFVGGMQSPIIKKFEDGYRAGVQYVNSDCKVASSYAGLTLTAFQDPNKGKELALTHYQKGADIIYQASGATGLGVYEAARETGKFAIGTDGDHWENAPGLVITSMVKRVDNAVLDTVQSVEENRFKGGIKQLDLASGGLDYLYNDNNKKMIPPDIRQKLELIRQDIIKGKIKIADY